MSAQAAQRMGLRVAVLDDDAAGPAGQVCEVVVGSWRDAAAVRAFAKRCDAVTLENEFVPAEVLRAAESLARLTPGVETLATIQDKMRQREAYAAHGVASPRAVDASAAPELGFPCVLKARYGGYDGKGTITCHTEADWDAARPRWEGGGWLAEEFVPFRRELAVMVWRTETEVGCFPTMETEQVNHVCDLVFPSGVVADAVAIAAVEAVGGFGLFGVELFEEDNGRLSVNEIAPRPHNTGHYTLNTPGASQFEQHVRLACGLAPAPVSDAPAAMANLLGIEDAGDWRSGLRAALEAEPSVHVHWYGKGESRPGRKMGHINAVGDGARERVVVAREAFYRGWAQ